jgi:hypothetical protein
MDAKKFNTFSVVSSSSAAPDNSDAKSMIKRGLGKSGITAAYIEF